jgi:hypothetical protein
MPFADYINLVNILIRFLVYVASDNINKSTARRSIICPKVIFLVKMKHL